MKVSAALANGAWIASSVPAWQRFKRALRNPGNSQRRILSRLLEANAESAYGRKYRFNELRSYEEFRDRTPIVNYDELEPWIECIRQGEKRVLACQEVTRLVPTSGSSGGRKLIPFSAAFQAEVDAAIAPWICDLFHQIPQAALGPAYWSISPAIPRSKIDHSAVPIGFDDDSAYLGGLKRRLVEATFAVPPRLGGVTDPDSARYFALLCLLREPELRLISVWHPSFLTLLLDALPGYWDELLCDLQCGQIRRAETLPSHLRPIFAASPQPRRADLLRAQGPGNPSIVRALWPNLAVVSCWGDAQAAFALSDLRRRIPHVHIQLKGLLATEAFVSIPFGKLHPIAITAHFFEFLDSRGNIFRPHELRPGETYEVIVTTGAGLWRYRLGDLVEVDGFAEKTPSLRFLGRGASVSDRCGEKLAETFVTRAIGAACQVCQFTPRFAMLAPESDSLGKWHYTFFVEGDLPTNLASQLEAELRENPHYALCRDLGQLGPLSVFQIAHDAYETFSEVEQASGCRLGDIKPRALSSRTDWSHCFSIRQSEGKGQDPSVNPV